MSAPIIAAAEPRWFDNSSDRRWWLLCEGLETLPRDRTLGLVQAADAFVKGIQEQRPLAEISTIGEASLAQTTRDDAAEHASVDAKRASVTRTSVALSVEGTELLNRLAAGARNEELAHQFGLTPKQVQGVKIGSARKSPRVVTVCTTKGHRPSRAMPTSPGRSSGFCGYKTMSLSPKVMATSSLAPGSRWSCRRWSAAPIASACASGSPNFCCPKGSRWEQAMLQQPMAIWRYGMMLAPSQAFWQVIERPG